MCLCVCHTLYVSVFQELFRFNVVKGATNMLRSANPIGFAALPLMEVCSKPFTRQEVEIRCVDTSMMRVVGPTCKVTL